MFGPGTQVQLFSAHRSRIIALIAHLLLTIQHGCTVLQAQEFVVNGGFETYNALPSDPSQWYDCTGWGSVNNYIGPFPYPPPYPGSPDYFHALGSGNYIVPPSTFNGNVIAHTGDAFMGLVTYYSPFFDEFREYLSTTLAAPLTVGGTYTLSYWLTSGNNAVNTLATSGFGACLSTGPLDQTDHEPIPVVPQFVQTTPFWSAGWQQVSFTFTATAAFDHLTLGNFSNDASTDTVDMLPVPVDGGYLFIDDVSLTGSSPFIAAFTDVRHARCDSVFVDLTDVSAGAISWQWSFPEAFPSASTEQDPAHIAYTHPGPHQITLIACNGITCDTVTHEVEVSIAPSPTVELGADTFLCPGQQMILTGNTTDAASFSWTHDGTPVPDNSGQLLIDVPGVYALTVSDTLGCSAVDLVNITEHALPIVDLGADVPICPGRPMIIPVPTTESEVLWSTGMTSGPLLISGPGVYWITVKNSCGSYTDTLFAYEDEEPEVHWPNAFTPNGDGLNDAFAPVLSGATSNVQWCVFDRWGELVHSASGASDPWDGRVNGQEVQEGVYVMVLTSRGVCGSPSIRRGHVTLLR